MRGEKLAVDGTDVMNSKKEITAHRISLSPNEFVVLHYIKREVETMLTFS